MAISKIKLANAVSAVALRDDASMHYVGHVDAGSITLESSVWTSTATEGTLFNIKPNDVVTQGNDNKNYVCKTAVIAGSTCTATYDLISEVVSVPVQDVTVDGVSILATGVAPFVTASDSALGLVKIGTNITIGDGEGGTTAGAISVPDATDAVKGVVQLSTTIPTSGAVDTKVATEKAVADAISGITEPMIFKGGATIAVDSEDSTKYAISGTTPAIANIKTGYTYKVTSINTTGYEGSLVIKEGDTLIATATNPGSDPETNWTIIPSGDEPAGTVTSVGVASGTNSNITITTGIGTGGADPITSSGTITVGVTSGHTIPEDTKITNWDNAYAKVNPYTEDSALVDGLAVSTTAESGDGSVLVAEVGTGNDADTLFIKYIKPTVSATVTAVGAPIS